MQTETLTPRDIQILKFISTNRFADRDLIKRRFWADRKSTNHYRRLTLLTKRRYLRPLLGDHGRTVGYQIGPKGWQVLKDGGVPVPRHKRSGVPYKSSFDHDKLLIEIREILTGSSLVSNFLPEHELKTILAQRYGRQEKKDHRYKVPDGLFKLKTHKGEFLVALELELAPKSRQRRDQMMKQLCISEDFSVIFFVAKDDQLRQKLERSLSEVRERDRLVRAWKYRHTFYFALLNDLVKNKLDAPFVGEGTSVVLSEIAKALANKPANRG
jgi:hypothetical protein